MFHNCLPELQKGPGAVLLLCGASHVEGIQKLATQNGIASLVVDIPNQQTKVKTLLGSITTIDPSELVQQINSSERKHGDLTVTKPISSDSQTANLSKIAKNPVKAAAITTDREKSFEQVYMLLQEADEHINNLQNLSLEPPTITEKIDGLDHIHNLLGEVDEHTARLENILKNSNIRVGLEKVECSDHNEGSSLKSTNVSNRISLGRGGQNK